MCIRDRNKENLREQFRKTNEENKERLNQIHERLDTVSYTHLYIAT